MCPTMVEPNLYFLALQLHGYTALDYFTHFYSYFFYIAFTLLYIVCAFTLLLLSYSYIFSFLIYCFFICVHTVIVVDILFYCDVYIILLC